jgi:FecR protein
VRNALAFLMSLLFPLVTGAHEFVATVTLAEGTNVLISQDHGYVPAAGVRLRHCDIIETGSKALVQVEIGDGGVIELGPDTRFLADLPSRSGEEAVIGPHFLLAGWVKFTVPKRAGPPHQINTPFFDLAINTGIAVLQVTAKGAQFFVENGEALALESSSSSTTRVAVRAGRMYSRTAGQPTGALADNLTPAPAFVKAMPPVFRDTLPPRLAALKRRNVEAKAGPESSARGVEDWRKSDPEVRRACQL